jgi:hypothetical protein
VSFFAASILMAMCKALLAYIFTSRLSSWAVAGALNFLLGFLARIGKESGSGAETSSDMASPLSCIIRLYRQRFKLP